jgi:hypothetical protein
MMPQQTLVRPRTFSQALGGPGRLFAKMTDAMALSTKRLRTWLTPIKSDGPDLNDN